MLETPVYVAVLDNYTLLSENLTTADNQQESLIIFKLWKEILSKKNCKSI